MDTRISAVRKGDDIVLNIEGNKVAIAGCSVGIVEFLGANSEFDEKVKQTDSACYEAKNSGTRHIHVFSP